MILCPMICGIVSLRCSRLVRRGVGGIPGRPPAEDRAALRGIVHVLRTGVTWADAPAETIGRSGVTCWRRLRDRTEAGVRPRLHEILLTELRNAGLLDMEDATVDGSHVRALTVWLRHPPLWMIAPEKGPRDGGDAVSAVSTFSGTGNPPSPAGGPCRCRTAGTESRETWPTECLSRQGWVPRAADARHRREGRVRDAGGSTAHRSPAAPVHAGMPSSGGPRSGRRLFRHGRAVDRDARLTLSAPRRDKLSRKTHPDLAFLVVVADRHLSHDVARGVRGDSGACGEGDLTCGFAAWALARNALSQLRKRRSMDLSGFNPLSSALGLFLGSGYTATGLGFTCADCAGLVTLCRGECRGMRRTGTTTGDAGRRTAAVERGNCIRRCALLPGGRPGRGRRTGTGG